MLPETSCLPLTPHAPPQICEPHGFSLDVIRHLILTLD